MTGIVCWDVIFDFDWNLVSAENCESLTGFVVVDNEKKLYRMKLREKTYERAVKRAKGMILAEIDRMTRLLYEMGEWFIPQ